VQLGKGLRSRSKFADAEHPHPALSLRERESGAPPDRAAGTVLEHNPLFRQLGADAISLSEVALLLGFGPSRDQGVDPLVALALEPGIGLLIEQAEQGAAAA
jgi:hypothetical protein